MPLKVRSDTINFKCQCRFFLAVQPGGGLLTKQHAKVKRVNAVQACTTIIRRSNIWNICIIWYRITL